MELGQIRLSADVGGTFTDVAAFDETTGELRLGKALTTPTRLVSGIEHGVTKAGAQFRAARLFLHGTTVAINTILERTGATCALLTTQGFRDIYEIGRVNRPESYNLFFRRHEPLIERDLRYELSERMDSQGKVLIKLDENAVRAAAADAVGRGVEAVAILFLHFYRNPAHEQRAKAIIAESYPDLFVTASHELSQEYREFERTSTAAANAYVGPRVRRYLGEMVDHLDAAGFAGEFLIVQSTGGLFGAEEAQSACIRMLESGPAAGVTGTKALCDRIGLKNAIAFDMGGTTAKAGVIHGGQVLMTGSALIGGYATGLPVQMPMIDIQEVGTGGGSIARVEMGGALHVGPESAGAQPGPVCYGRGGTEPTITDANLILGRLAADRFLGGEMRLDVEGARGALEARVAAPLGLDLTAAADGILRIATTKMSHMVRWVTTERGLDAAEFSLVAYGGAGPLHAAMVARELRIAQVVIPRAPGHFSAYGMLVADLRRDFVNTWFTPLAEASFATMEKFYAEMETRGREAVQRSGIAVAGTSVQRAADMRYVGQEHAVTVELPVELFRAEDRDGIKRRFDSVHETRYGYSAPAEKAEIVSLRTAITGLLRKPTFEPITVGEAMPPPAAFRGTREVYFAEAGRAVDTPTYDRAALLANNRIAGPVLIEEVDDRRASRRRGRGRCLRRSRDRNPAELTMDVALKPKPASTGHRVDPVTTEIVRNGLIAATEEMKTNLMRTAYNMIIYEALDFTVGLFDAQGNTVSIGLGLPMFIRGMSDTVKTKLNHYGLENLDPGDILLTNDAYITGSHLNHMTFTVPIFHDGEVVAFSCCMAHWPDVGGTLDGATTDIFSEGLQMPIVKIYRKGVPNEELISVIKINVRLPERAMGDFRAQILPNEELISVIKINVRLPERAMGDFRAQIAAVRTGERRFLEMIGKYGRDAVLGGIAAIMDHSEAATRARVREIRSEEHTSELQSHVNL